MRALLFLAVFALATQVHMSSVTEFYRTFINTIPMEIEAKNRIMNDGLDCINWATNVLASSVQSIQHDLHNEDLINTLRHAIGSAQVFEQMVLPKCAQTHMELTSYLHEHRNLSNINSYSKIRLFEARLIQLMGMTVVDVLNKQPNAVAKDLATFLGTGFGLIDAQLPHIHEFNYSNYVPQDENKVIPQFLKGFFTGLGYNDLAKINATSQCILDVIGSIQTVVTNPALQRGDFYTRAFAFLDSVMPITDSIERCKRLQTVDPVVFQRLTRMFLEYPAESIARVLGKSIVRAVSNTVLDLPTIRQSEINMGVYMLEGKYEQAGRLYAMTVRTIYNGIL